MLFLMMIAVVSVWWACMFIYELRTAAVMWELRARVAVECPEILAGEPRSRRILLVVLTGGEIVGLALMLLNIVACVLGMAGVGPLAPERGLL